MALKTEKIPSEERPPDGRFDKLPHNELLVKPPFTMVITGSIGSGKSSIFIYKRIYTCIFDANYT